MYVDCLFNRLLRRSATSSGLSVYCEWNPLLTGGFPSQRASNAENVFKTWRHQHGSYALIFPTDNRTIFCVEVIKTGDPFNS